MAKTLYVAPTGNDATTYDANTQANPWRSLHKAAGEARTGDTVRVAAGTYASTGTGTRSRFQVLYNPAQPGVTFQADGRVTLTSASAGPLIGAEGRGDVKWIGPFFIDEANAPQVPDTGPVVFFRANGGVIDGAEVKGANRAVQDNHTGVRIEQSNGVTVRNCTLHGFRSGGGVGENDACVMLYDSNDCVIEQNALRDTGTGVYVKGRHPEFTQLRTVVRFNRIGPGLTRMGVALVDADESRVYQNLIIGSTASGFGAITYYGLGGGPRNTLVYNNTIHNNDIAVLLRGSAQSWTGARFLNNLITGGRLAWGSFQFSTIGPLTADRNGYHGQTERHAALAASNLTFAQWQAAGREPNGSTVQPQYVDTLECRLSAGSPARSLGRDVLTGATIPIGAYITDSDVMGPRSGVAEPEPQPSCTYLLSPLSAQLPATGGTGVVALTTNLATCAWSAVSSAAWLVVTPNGTGSRAVSYTAAPNSGAERSATITIQGQVFTLTQAAADVQPTPRPTASLREVSAGPGMIAWEVAVSSPSGAVVARQRLEVTL